MTDTQAHALARSLDTTTVQLRLAGEVGGIIVWQHDLKANRLVFNDHGIATLGLQSPPEGVTLEQIRARFHPDDLQHILSSELSTSEESTTVDFEARLLTHDGTWRHLLMRRIAQRSATGELTGYIGVALDISERIGQLHRAESLAQWLQATARAARMGIWTTTLGTPHIEWNAQMFELFDMAGATQPPPLHTWLKHSVHPDDLARVEQAMTTYLCTGLGAFEVEFRSLRRDGGVRWIVIRADSDGSQDPHRKIFGIAMDVTDRHQAQAALHAASERAALIASSAGIGTWESDHHHGVDHWDAQMFRLRGLAPRDSAPSREERLALVHPDDRELLWDSRARRPHRKQPIAYEFRARLPDGSYRWLASRSTAILDAHGEVIRRVGVNWDITESKSAEQARQQALIAERESQAKSAFLSRMSHELRTPLNAVLGFTQLLQLEAQQAQAHSQLGKLDHIQKAGEHLLSLINHVLDLSTLQTSSEHPPLQRVAVADAVHAAQSTVVELATLHRIAVHSQDLQGATHANPTRLIQVLTNLLSNAIKYNRPGGQVRITTRREADRVIVSVQDTGRGMRADQLEHLFEPFNRLGVEAEGIEGAGMGLTIAKAIVDSLCGTLRIRSEPGIGTTVELDLPAIDTHPSTNPNVTPAAARSGQLLYIEDNPVNVLLVEELVRNLSGLSIVSESTGAAGIETARRLKPDLILIDVQLPDFDGFEVLRQLRTHPETTTTACIALSADANPEDIARARTAGFDDYWTKPIKFKEFLNALERLFPA